ncbi:MAG TPA: alpha/beta hydrolase domain-containing protein, partial [Longimicrobiales bacterium]|nr:alpha/beta hydrolase domain-containing protein [Longimicrobiales bacterium]
FPTSRGVAFGVSQTGRFLRHFLFQGFNVDEGGRKVFDGMLIHTAGAGRGSFNHRFGQASRDAHRYSAFFYPTDLFPFTSLPQADPVTGMEGGLLDALPAALRPRVMVTNTGYEYWGRAASLIHTTVDGLGDVPPAPTERIYHLAGGQHYVGPFPPDSAAALPGTPGYAGNPVDFLFTLRALALRLVAWVQDDAPPPPSRIPAVAQGTLVPPRSLAFPRIPGVDLPQVAHQAYRADYGPRFRSEGIIDIQPPRLGLIFSSLVPQVDGFGNELGGVRGLELRVPVATYTPWRLRTGMAGGNGELHDFEGSVYPLPVTDREADAAGDSRASLQRVYGSREAYRLRLEAAAQGLVREGFLLEEDLGVAVARGLAFWDWIVGPVGN